MKVSVLTLGCKTNQAESSQLEADLHAKGWQIVGLKDKPDICVVNTCSVTARTDYESRQLIRRAKNAGARVVVTGCYSQLNRESVSSMEGVRLVVDNDKKAQISEMIDTNTSFDGLDVSRTGKSRLFVKVQDGCNGACSYCIIPRARGRSRSIEPDVIVKQISAAASLYSEVVLTAIHLGTYGYELVPSVSLSYLLKRCLLETSIKRIRLSSLETNEIDDELLEIIQDKRICRHLHIPLQSGDDRILREMRRGYSAEPYSRKLLKIHRVVPDANIGTDVIVGFPGETDEEFNNTYNLLESLPISYIHVFPFSARPGTPAAELAARVDPHTVRERSARVRRLSARKRSEYMTCQVGQTLDLLVERIEGPDSVLGITGNYLRGRAFLSDVPARALVAVGVTGVDDNQLIAYPI